MEDFHNKLGLVASTRNYGLDSKALPPWKDVQKVDNKPGSNIFDNLSLSSLSLIGTRFVISIGEVADDINQV
jgi:hypothetical protein